MLFLPYQPSRRQRSALAGRHLPPPPPKRPKRARNVVPPAATTRRCSRKRKRVEGKMVSWECFNQSPRTRTIPTPMSAWKVGNESAVGRKKPPEGTTVVRHGQIAFTSAHDNGASEPMVLHPLLPWNDAWRGLFWKWLFGSFLGEKGPTSFQGSQKTKWQRRESPFWPWFSV